MHIEKLKVFFSYDKEQVYQILKYISGSTYVDSDTLIKWILMGDTFRIFKKDNEYIRKLSNSLVLTGLLTFSENYYIVTPKGLEYLNSN